MNSWKHVPGVKQCYGPGHRCPDSVWSESGTPGAIWGAQGPGHIPSAVPPVRQAGRQGPRPQKSGVSGGTEQHKSSSNVSYPSTHRRVKFLSTCAVMSLQSLKVFENRCRSRSHERNSCATSLRSSPSPGRSRIQADVLRKAYTRMGFIFILPCCHAWSIVEWDHMRQDERTVASQDRNGAPGHKHARPRV